jgi:hypothetical protein
MRPAGEVSRRIGKRCAVGYQLVDRHEPPSDRIRNMFEIDARRVADAD